MIILGLQFGHDGSVCVLKDGEILSYVYRERECRVKHAMGITTHEINRAFEIAGITESDIDYCAIISTQNIEILHGLIDDFSINFTKHTDDSAPSPYADLLKQQNQNVEAQLSFQLSEFLQKKQNTHLIQYEFYSAMLPEKEAFEKNNIAVTGWLDNYIATDSWNRGMPLEQIARQNVTDTLQSPVNKYGFHYPITVTLRGKELPGAYIQHHMAHAASCFYRSGFDESAIITHDGFGNGVGYHSGAIFYGKDNEITTAHPHHLAIGAMYDTIGLMLKLGNVGPAGKLMGLAPYGKPRFFNHSFVGNWYDIQQRFNEPFANIWKSYCVEMAQHIGYDMSALGDKDRITDPVNADIAASTQKLFEECYLYTVHTAHRMFLSSGIATPNLCLSGGTALNCPSNSRIHNEGPYDNMFIEPSCGDDGLAIGAALYVYHHLYKNPVKKSNAPYISPYLGLAPSEDNILAALKAHNDNISFEKIDDAAKQAAKDVHENKVIAWFEGGSESGPRALCHRSLIANPTHEDNWKRVNIIKGREWWRPFAPTALEEEAQDWFSGLPNPSPYMLFTGQVISDKLPAIKHVDGSSRIQTVNSSAGECYNMIKEFHKLSGIPVVMNTSFNGPGEPIIETPEQAINFLLNTELDTLYMNGYKVTKAA